ncbi:hypothetical protein CAUPRSCDRAFT_12527 [Caulochytrium protostelioides]|uniref:Uncharacterized protein n=1 Tax=Caulochytrium protostelioides TaxID=1555241 RepID=A0A4P9WU66_9FUNG|nr:hypothetical protein CAUPRSCDRAFT_12527 [Caulochytrium protostelioides]
MRLLLAGRSPSALRHPPSNTAIQLYFAEVGVVLRSIDVGPLDGETAAGAATETWVTVNTVDHVLHLLGRATPLPELDGHRVELVLRRDVPFRRPVPGKRPTCGYAEYPADRLISFEFDPVASAQLVRTRVAAAQRPAAPAPAPVPRLIEDGTSDGEGDIFERTQAEAAGAHAVPATDTDAAPLTADLQHWTPPLIAAALAEHTAVQRVDYVPGDRAGVALLTTRGSAATVVALLKQIQFGGKAAQPSGTRTDPLIKLDDVMAMRRAAIRVAAYDGAAEVLMHRIRKVRAAAGAVTPAYPPGRRHRHCRRRRHRSPGGRAHRRRVVRH